MLTLESGQCGLCSHFGQDQSDSPQLVQIRTSKSAPENFTSDCGHPQLKPLDLTVTATSGCQGFEPAVAA
jgi:hypothetical protein